MIWNPTGIIKIKEIEDGIGPLDQNPERKYGYHLPLEGRYIRKKGARVSTRYIIRLERRVNIHNYLHPYILKVENHLTSDYLWHYKLKKRCSEPKRFLIKRPRSSES